MPKSFDQLAAAARAAAAPADDSTRGRLLRAAIELIAELGWGAVTTRKLAERAAVNQALVHYHFGSVGALLHEAAYAAMAAVFGPASARVLGADDPAAGVRGAIEAIEQIDLEAPEPRVVVEATVQSMRDPELNAAMRELLPAFRELLAQRLADARREGRIGAGVDPAGAAVAIGALLDGLGLHRMIDPRTDTKAAVSAVLAMLEAGR